MSQKKSWPTNIRPMGKGLQIRLFEKGRAFYYETIECDPFRKSDLAAAVKRRDFLKGQYAAGLLQSNAHEPEETLVDPHENEIFCDAAQDYINTLEAKDRVIKEYLRILNGFWMPHLKHDVVSEIPKSKIKGIVAAWKVSSKTKKNRLIPFYGVYKHLELTPPNIKLRKHQKTPVQRYKPRERDKLMRRLAHYGQASLYFALLFGCGLRPGEALAIQRTDREGSELNICKQITDRKLDTETKTYQWRTVYMPEWVRKVWDQHPAHLKGAWMFQNSIDGPHLDTDWFNGIWKEAHQKCRIPYRLPYACRHTRCAELLSIGMMPARAAKELGHSLQMFYNVYSELIEEYQADLDRSDFEGVQVKLGRES